MFPWGWWDRSSGAKWGTLSRSPSRINVASRQVCIPMVFSTKRIAKALRTMMAQAMVRPKRTLQHVIFWFTVSLYAMWKSNRYEAVSQSAIEFLTFLQLLNSLLHLQDLLEAPQKIIPKSIFLSSSSSLWQASLSCEQAAHFIYQLAVCARA